MFAVRRGAAAQSTAVPWASTDAQPPETGLHLKIRKPDLFAALSFCSSREEEEEGVCLCGLQSKRKQLSLLLCLRRLHQNLIHYSTTGVSLIREQHVPGLTC
uniref:Putative secreted protein n=1 Tax=Anopheles marajoara TaxID=58244 RepID=A0A2M4C8K7_9DIPT